MHKLPLWIEEVHHGEPAHGALLRIAHLNGFGLTTDAIEQLGGVPTWIYSTQTTDVVLQELGENLAGPVRQWTPIFEGGRYVHVNGERLSNKLHWVRSTRRFCPKCLSESPHHRVWWDCKAITTCPVHAVELEHACSVPGCIGKVRWTHSNLIECEFGHDLRISSRSVPECEIKADRYIAGRLGLSGSGPVPFLDTTYLDEAIELMDIVGRAAIGGNRSTMPSWSALGASARIVRSRGLEILACGTDGFDDLLEHIARSIADGSVSRGLLRRYGWLTTRLHQGPQSSIHLALLAQMNRHARGHVFTGADDDPNVSLKNAAAQLNTSTRRLRAMLVARGFIRAGLKSGLPVGLSREDVEMIRALLADTLSLKQTAIRIGEPQPLLARLIKDDILPTVFPRRAVGIHAHVIKWQDLQSLIERLTGGVAEVKFAPPDLLPMRALCRATTMTYCDVIRLVIDNGVKPAARLIGRPPINGLLFNCKEVTKAFHNQTVAAFTATQVMKELRIDDTVLRLLIEHKHIHGELRIQNKRKIVAIEPEELARFKATFVGASDYAKRFGTNPNHACRKLIALGLEPAISAKQCRRTFFLRQEVEAVLSKVCQTPTCEEVRALFWTGLKRAWQQQSSKIPMGCVNGPRVLFPSGVTGVRLAVVFASKSARLRLGFVINSFVRTEIRALLHSELAAIARESRIELKWTSGKKRQEQWVLADCPHGKLFDQSTWPEVYRWATEGLTRLIPAIQTRLIEFRYRRAA